MLIKKIVIRDPFTNKPRVYGLGYKEYFGYTIKEIEVTSRCVEPLDMALLDVARATATTVLLKGDLETTELINPDIISVTYS